MNKNNTKRLNQIILIIFILVSIYFLVLLNNPYLLDNKIIKNVSPFLSVIFSGLIIYSLYLQAKSIDEDYSWKRKHATFEYIQKIRPIYEDSFKFIIRELKGTNKDDRLNKLLDPKTKSQVKKFLSTWERVGIGVRNGIFDLDIINDKSGGYIIGSYEKYFKSYINHTRQKVYKKKGYVFVYDDFIYLVEQLKIKRKKKIEEFKKNESKTYNSY